MDRKYDLENYNYDLPGELIASRPTEKRTGSRMLVLDRKTGKLEDKKFKEIEDYFQKGDILVLNDTRVFPARFYGIKVPTGAKIELMLIENLGKQNLWEALSRPYKRLKEGTKVKISEDGYAVIKKRLGSGKVEVEFVTENDFFTFAENSGHVPLPPYINREDKPADRERYQTVFARKKGAVAAPTAGLHFSDELIKKLKSKGVEILFVTLHVGYGTFAPIDVEDIREFQIHSEYYEVKEEVYERLKDAKAEKRRVWACGTTSVRTLEYIFQNPGKLSGKCDLYIYPPFDFKVVDRMITNFHLPKTSLMLLVSAFGGYENIMKAYYHAIDKEYRFYSYGDSMVIK